MRNPIPWIGLAAIAAMFLLPWLDARGLLTFEAVAVSDRCWPARTILRPKPAPMEVVMPQPEMPCCSRGPKMYDEE